MYRIINVILYVAFLFINIVAITIKMEVLTIIILSYNYSHKNFENVTVNLSRSALQNFHMIHVITVHLRRNRGNSAKSDFS